MMNAIHSIKVGAFHCFGVHSYLVKKAKCLAMFATHYHSLVEDWGHHAQVQPKTCYCNAYCSIAYYW